MTSRKNEADELKDIKAKAAAYGIVCDDMVRRCEENTDGWMLWGGAQVGFVAPDDLDMAKAACVGLKAGCDDYCARLGKKIKDMEKN